MVHSFGTLLWKMVSFCAHDNTNMGITTWSPSWRRWWSPSWSNSASKNAWDLVVVLNARFGYCESFGTISWCLRLISRSRMASTGCRSGRQGELWGETRLPSMIDRLFMTFRSIGVNLTLSQMVPRTQKTRVLKKTASIVLGSRVTPQSSPWPPTACTGRSWPSDQSKASGNGSKWSFFLWYVTHTQLKS